MLTIERDGEKLLVPRRVEQDGLIGDGMCWIGPDDAEYAEWLEYADAHKGQAAESWVIEKRIKSAPGQREFDWDEQKHPRDQKGEFSSKGELHTSTPRTEYAQHMKDFGRQHLGEHGEAAATEWAKHRNHYGVKQELKKRGVDDTQAQDIARKLHDASNAYRKSKGIIEAPLPFDLMTEDEQKQERERWNQKHTKERETDATHNREFAEKHWKDPPPAEKCTPKEYVAIQLRSKIAEIEADKKKLKPLFDLHAKLYAPDREKMGWQEYVKQEDEYKKLCNKRTFKAILKKYLYTWNEEKKDHAGSVHEMAEVANMRTESFQHALDTGTFYPHSETDAFNPAKEHAQAVQRAAEEGRDVPDNVVKEYRYEDWLPQKLRDQMGALSRVERWESHINGSDFALHREQLRQTMKLAEPKIDEIIKGADTKPSAETKKLQDAELEHLAKVTDICDRLATLVERSKKFRDGEGDASEFDTIRHDRKDLHEKLNESSTLLEQSRKDLEVARKADGRRFLESMLPAQAAKIDLPVSEHLDESGRASLTQAQEFLSKLISPKLIDSVQAKIAPIEANSQYGPHRAYARNDTMHIEPNEDVRTIVHEFGHILDHVTGTDELSAAFAVDALLKHDQSPEHMGGGYEAGEVGNKDGFRSKYCGKFYGGASSEVLSMGLQYLYEDPVAFLKESPEHFKYTMAVIHGLV